MTKDQKFKSNCIDCDRETNHSLLGSHTLTESEDEYHFDIQYSIIQCLGCDQISFLKVIHDYQTAFPVKQIMTSNGYDYEYDYDRITRNFYPNTEEVFYKFEKFLPAKLFEIYVETKKAYVQNLNIFTAIGLRSIIECICKDKDIPGKDLEKKITNLKSLGDISKKDIELLHSLRFLGNEAVHQFIKAPKKDLNIAFKIVDHLIQTIYIMPKELENTNFKKHIGDYETFENYIKEKTGENDNSKIQTIKGILGEKGKISNDLLVKLEMTLKENIESGVIDWLEIIDSSNLPKELCENETGVFYKRKELAS